MWLQFILSWVEGLAWFGGFRPLVGFGWAGYWIGDLEIMLSWGSG